MFRVFNSDFLLAPASALFNLTHFDGVRNCEPAWTLYFSFQNEKLEHGLLCPEHSFERVAC